MGKLVKTRASGLPDFERKSVERVGLLVLILLLYFLSAISVSKGAQRSLKLLRGVVT